MTRLLGTIAATILIGAGSLLSAQAPTSSNITVAVTNPPAVQCSAPFKSSIGLTGFDVQDPGVADIVFVLDESGSIDSTSFNQMKQFASQLAQGLMTGAGGARIGLAMFDGLSGSPAPPGRARTIFNLSDNTTSVLNGINSVVQARGFTCIGCGIQQGRAIFAASAPRPEATQFMIVLTDGQNNRTSVGTQNPAVNLAAVVNDAKAAGIKLLAIGVTSNVAETEIELIASDIPGVQTAFFTPDFASLTQIIGQLTAAIVSPGSTNVTVNVDVMPRFPVTSAVASAGAVAVTGSTVTWTLPSLGSGGQTLMLDHLHDGTGNGPLQIFAATYTDAEGHTVTIPDAFTVVNGCNTAPVANAGPDQTVALSGTNTTTVTLDGSASTDDGLVQPLTYAWSSGAITGAGASPSVTLPFGTHVFTLTVDDGEFTDTDMVTIDVVDPTPPVVVATVTGTSSGGWYTSDVSVSFTTTDPESGIATTSGCGPFTVTTDTAGQTFSCTATNGAGASTTEEVTVKRDATGPEITGLAPSTGSLWPPNHQMVGITIDIDATDALSAAVCTVTGVTSSEPDNGLGDGDTANDTEVTGPSSVNLRAERAGKGQGRVYTIAVTCTDAAGNTTTGATTVSVPKSRGR